VRHRILLSLVSVCLALLPAVGYAEPDTVQVFFSHDPESFNDFTAVFPQPRVVPGGLALMEQSVAALLAGPTAAEQAAGFYSDFHNLIVPGPSTCKGQDFTFFVSLGVATVQLCHQTSSAGIGQDARAQSEINATLMQFGGITKVIVLGATGHCLFDESGLDLCLV
jgi:hypothetical protein